ncbi:MAG: site-2 protease family protein [Defluviitaleaceae bacterium]|nr:site-2 protease family protein [Defluviitaleaceae bacterium]
MRYLYLLPAAILVPVIHEWVKALVSTAQGDPAPRNHGYMTANPFKFFEPIGFLFVMLFGFGWGRPVPTTALHYKDRQMGIILTYTIPVVVNLLLGVAAVIGVNALATSAFGPGDWDFRMFFVLAHFPFWTSDISQIGILLLANFAFVNINLALFNLIPVYPLAANKLLITFSRADNIARFNHYEKPMQIILILLLAFGIIPNVLAPISEIIVRMAWGIF